MNPPRDHAQSEIDQMDHQRLVKEALLACQRLLETSHYLCLCGAGITTGGDCEYHQRIDRAARALKDAGYAPSWFKENEDADRTAEVIEPDGIPGPEGPAKPGVLGTLPNCS